MDELSRFPGKSLLFAIEVSGDEILHVFDVRFQTVAGDIETENVDDFTCTLRRFYKLLH